MRTLLSLGLCGLFACGPGKAPESLREVERVVFVSDQVAASPTYATSYSALLERNDDGLFPFFKGKDLASQKVKVGVVRFDRGADGFLDLAKVPDFPCTCAGKECGARPACIDAESGAGTVVVIQIGTNDLISVFFQLVSSQTLRSDLTPTLNEFRASVKSVLARMTDPKIFPRPPRIVLATVYDPSDDVGDLAKQVQATFPVQGIHFELVTPELSKRVLDGFNQVLKEEAEASHATLLDIREHFLGHGYHFDDPANPHHQAADATHWFRSLVDPNLRGAHEIRRLLWAALSKEDVAEVPMGLPADSTLGLPAIPAAGWANAVVDKSILKSFISERYGGLLMVNAAQDAKLAVGPADGTDNSVAIGVVGNFILLDMGENEEVSDGPGDDLVVLEFGLKSGGVPERYRVLLAESATGPFVPLAEAAGEQSFDISKTGLQKARYVRIESLVRLSDVENGLGSPLYPGPEIDAVGAVYPGKQ
jgi:hypothetical protein